MHAISSGGGEGGCLSEEGCGECDAVELHGLILFVVLLLLFITAALLKDRHAAY